MRTTNIQVTEIGGRTFELEIQVNRSDEPARYGVRACDPDPTERYDGLIVLSLDFPTLSQAQVVFDALVATARHFESRWLVADVRAELRLEGEEVEVK